MSEYPYVYYLVLATALACWWARRKRNVVKVVR
jgi:hypothetical protein